MKSIPISFIFCICSMALFAQVYVDRSAGGAVNGTSWQDAYTTVYDGIRFADAGTEIWIATGTYTVPQNMESFVIEKELSLFGGFGKTETSVNQRIIHENPTVFSADRNSDDIPQNLQSNRSDNAKHVLNITTDDALVYISGITFAGGSANLQGEFGDDDASGGGVLAAGRVTFHFCHFTNNAAAFGGGILVKPTGHLSEFLSCTFEYNGATRFGGGIYADDPVSNLKIDGSLFFQNFGGSGGGVITGGVGSSAVITSSRFMSNSARRGAGLQCDLAGNIRIYGCLFDNNTANLGAGVRIQGFSQALIENCTFSENRVSADFFGNLGNGGAGQIVDDSDATFKNCNFLYNFARNTGGAINVILGSSCKLESDNFSNNAAGLGAGAVFVSSEGQLESVNTKYSSNIILGGEGVAGGAVILAGQVTATFTNDVFDSNQSPDGGAIYMENGAVANITTSWFEQNSATFAGAISAFGAITLNIDQSNFGSNIAAWGGAIYLFEGPQCTITDCDFDGNLAELGAGAIIYDGSAPSVCTGCFFTFNRVIDDNGGGGAVSIQGADVDFESCTFMNNSCPNDGGAINAFSPFDLNISNSEFRANSAAYGGAIEAEGPSLLSIDRTLIIDNEASIFGGGLCVWEGSQLTLNRSELNTNRAPIVGGLSILSDADESLDHIITKTKFINNSADFGAGAINHFDGDLSVENCLFDKNSSPENGSAIWTDDDGDVENPLKITNVTFVNHAGTLGGVIAVGGDDSDRAHVVLIQNTILANNGADIVRNKGNTEIVSAGGNLSVVDNSHQLNHESDIHNTNPLFIDRENGDYRLRNISPAVNAGVSPAPETDIVGNARLGNPDIGAYENQNNESNVIGYKEQEFVLEVGPNPATDMLRVEAPEEFHNDYQLSIIGMDGNPFVSTLHVTRNQSIMEARVNHLPSGTYIVQIKARNGLVARSLFVKQ